MKAIKANAKNKAKIMPKLWCWFTLISESKLISKGMLSTKIVKNQLNVMRPISILKSIEKEKQKKYRKRKKRVNCFGL